MTDRWVWEDSTWLRTDDFLPEVIIFARNYDKPMETKTFTISDFRPYFYCPADASFHPREVTQVDSKTSLDAKGRSIRKVFTRLPSDVSTARKSYDWTVEADIQFDFRHMLDVDVSYAFSFDEHNHIVPATVPKAILPRICFFDIEVRSPPTQFPKPAEAKWPIVSIQCMDSYTGLIQIFTFGVPQLADDQVACRTENELLREFMNYLQATDPDVLTGWNTNGFDIPYIVTRAKNLKVKLNRMTRLPNGYNKPVAEIRQGMPAETPEEEKKRKRRKEEWFVRCTGRQLLDMLDAFKKYWKAEGELDSYTLKSIARNPDVMGDDVYVYEEQGSNMEKLFTEERWDDFLSYCRSDVIALDKIDKRIKLIDFYENLRMMCGIKLEDTMKNSRMIESLLFRDPIMKPMPTRRYDIVGESYEGALVLTPEVGVFHNVAVYDLNALYPNIIIAFDLSPDIDHVIPRVIKYVLDERVRLKKLIKDGLAEEADKKKEVVLKFIANSFYGVLGWDKFRCYDPEIAAFITRTGREINEYLQGLTRDLGLVPVYGDTDSVFVRGVDTVEYGVTVQDHLNEKLRNEWTPAHNARVAPQLKFEELFDSLLFKASSTNLEESAKKRYAGHVIFADGKPADKLMYKGIEARRSDQAELTKSVLLSFLDLVLINNDYDKAIELVKRAYYDIRDGHASLLDISIPQGVTDMEKNSPRVRGVLLAEALFGTPYTGGEKPRLLYTRGNHDAFCIYDGIPIDQIPLKVRIDYPLMAEKIITKKMESYVLALGVNLRHVLEGQQTLSSTWFE